MTVEGTRSACICFAGSCVVNCFFFKQTTAYEVRISDWSSDVCSSDLLERVRLARLHESSAALVEAGDVDAYAAFNLAFHEAIYSATHKDRKSTRLNSSH